MADASEEIPLSNSLAGIFLKSKVKIIVLIILTKDHNRSPLAQPITGFVIPNAHADHISPYHAGEK